MSRTKSRSFVSLFCCCCSLLCEISNLSSCQNVYQNEIRWKNVSKHSLKHQSSGRELYPPPPWTHKFFDIIVMSHDKPRDFHGKKISSTNWDQKYWYWLFGYTCERLKFIQCRTCFCSIKSVAYLATNNVQWIVEMKMNRAPPSHRKKDGKYQFFRLVFARSTARHDDTDDDAYTKALVSIVVDCQVQVRSFVMINTVIL